MRCCLSGSRLVRVIGSCLNASFSLPKIRGEEAGQRREVSCEKVRKEWRRG